MGMAMIAIYVSETFQLSMSEIKSYTGSVISPTDLGTSISTTTKVTWNQHIIMPKKYFTLKAVEIFRKLFIVWANC